MVYLLNSYGAGGVGSQQGRQEAYTDAERRINEAVFQTSAFIDLGRADTEAVAQGQAQDVAVLLLHLLGPKTFKSGNIILLKITRTRNYNSKHVPLSVVWGCFHKADNIINPHADFPLAAPLLM